jgi:homoserine kinase type II
VGRPDAPTLEPADEPADEPVTEDASPNMADPQPLPPRVPHIGPMLDPDSRSSRFSRDELAIILSHYELGAIKRVRALSRGSRRAPKLLIESELGQFFLKRRAPGRDDPYRVAFAHCLQLQLSDWRFPVPRIIGTRSDGNSMLQSEGYIYELYDYVEGRRTDRAFADVRESGTTLGRLHHLLDGFEPRFPAPRGSYHGSSEAENKFAQAALSLQTAEPDIAGASITQLVRSLKRSYREAARKVDDLGYSRWHTLINHGDWHPGNLLYRDHKVVAVLDFDSARLEPRMADVANGALQFSIRMSRADEPRAWPAGLDVKRLKSFFQGYDSASKRPLSSDERTALPWLIIEALIIESIVPVAATGSFARVRGSEFLEMVRSKVRWIKPRAKQLVEFLEQAEE